MDLRTYLQKDGRGSAARLAQAIGSHPPDVNTWALGKRACPIQRCVAIEQATDGLVTRRDLRPDDWQDIWPELAEKATA